MKTLKILIALFIVLGFATNAMNAQPAKAWMTWDVSWGPITITPTDNECLTEDIVGTFHYQGWWLTNHWQERMTGEFIGQTTNLIYTFTGLTQHHVRYNPHEGNWGGAYNEKLWCEGKMVGMLHFNGLTNWVNDELHLDILNTQFSCK